MKPCLEVAFAASGTSVYGQYLGRNPGPTTGLADSGHSLRGSGQWSRSRHYGCVRWTDSGLFRAEIRASSQINVTEPATIASITVLFWGRWCFIAAPIGPPRLRRCPAVRHLMLAAARGGLPQGTLENRWMATKKIGFKGTLDATIDIGGLKGTLDAKTVAGVHT